MISLSSMFTRYASVLSFESYGTSVVSAIFPWAILILILIVLRNLFVHRKLTKHQYKINSADKILKKIGTIKCQSGQFCYIRKVDPFVFEEMILSALKMHGHEIIRNKKYTGDGGIDGRVIVGGFTLLIQAKRYSGYIRQEDVNTFAAICKRQNRKGLFIHSGKTGKASHVQAKKNPHIKIISGNSLLNLLTNFD